MGRVTISIEGSFFPGSGAAEHVSFFAEEGGHAHALTRAVANLTDRLPAAIELDHKLHDEGSLPSVAPFGRCG